MTLAQSVTRFTYNMRFDLYASEGRDPTAAQIVDHINWARMQFNIKRHLYRPFLTFPLVAGQSEYPYASSSFEKRVLQVYGGWLNRVRTRDENGNRGVMSRSYFEETYPNWPHHAPGTSRFMVEMGRNLLVWPPPTADFIALAAVPSEGRTVRYRIDLASATGSTYKITLNGQETSGLGPLATVASVQSALEALSNVVPGDVNVLLVDGTRHIYDIVYITGSSLGSALSITLTSNTLTGGGTASCTLMSAAIMAQVMENNMTTSVEDAVELPEPEEYHRGIVDLANIEASKWVTNEDEAWRRLTSINAGVVEMVEREGRESRAKFLSFKNTSPTRIRR